MPSDDLILNLRQIASYPAVGTAQPSDAILIQRGGIGGPYNFIDAADLVATALSMSPETLTAQSIQAGTIANSLFNGGTINGSNFNGGAFSGSSGNFNALSIANEPVATQAYADGVIAQLNGLYQTSTVWTFNGRSGSVILFLNDILGAGGAPISSPQFLGCPTAPTPAPGDNSTNLATTAFVQNAILNQQEPGLAPLNSPAFAGVPTAPTAAPGTSTGQLATTAFVEAAITASTAGVASFNTRTGPVVLDAADITAAGGAVLVSPAFTGTPTAPTAAPGTNTTQLATTAYVMAALPASLVSSFNTRTGPITLTSADITGAGGALAANVLTSFNGRVGSITFQANDLSAVGGAMLASPAFTGVPTGPTAVAGTNTQQLATTAFVLAAIGGVNAGVLTFNGRAGDITLTSADVNAAGGPYAPTASPSFTGLVTLSDSGIKGVTDGSSAPPGSVGEYVSVSSSPTVTVPTASTWFTVNSLTLTAGDWDVTASYSMGNPGGSLSGTAAAISTTSGSLSGQVGQGVGCNIAGIYSDTRGIPTLRFSSAVLTTLYVIVSGTWTGGTTSAEAVIIARRVR